jgi:proline dehydrogenase
MSLSFDNTEVAFRSRSNADLNRSYLLFSLISNPSWVKTGKWLTETALKLHLPIKGIIRKTIYKQFVGGENIQDCKATIAQLGKYGVGTILDYSVEGKESDEDFERTTAETIATVERGAGDANIPFCVFKVTGLAPFALLETMSAEKPLQAQEEHAWKKVQDRVNRICAHAASLKVPVFIDAEESWIQDAIDQLALDMMRKYNRERCIVYNTYQLYRYDRLDFLSLNIRQAKEESFFMGAKLVRGAYMEKERARAEKMGYTSPINPNKESTDKMFNDALRLCVQHISVVSFCAGTHNEKSSMLLAELMKENNIAPQDKRVYFSQLLGMSDHISFNLAGSGFHVAKYVPYGPVKEVMPYLFRRAQENTSVKGQTGRELSLIIKERKRRKQG